MKTEEESIQFHEHSISSPIQTPNEDGNLASTICGIELGEGGHLVFNIDSGLGDHDILIEEVSTENLIYIIGEIESID